MDNPDDDGFLAAVLDAWSQIQLERQPAVRNKARYRQRTRENAGADPELTAKAQRWHAEYELSPQHLAQCLADDKPPAAHYRRKDPA